MPQITLIKLQKNNKIANIFIDNQFVASLDLVSVKKYRLKEGIDISRQDLNNLLEKSAYEKLLAYAYRYLSYRPRSEKETKTYLLSKIGFQVKSKNTKLIDKVIKKLKALGMLDDQKFSDWWVKQRVSFRQRGKRMIRGELRLKGVDEEIIQKALQGLNEKQAALDLIEKKSKRLKSRQPNTAKEYLISMLLRRGFTWDIIREVVDESCFNK